MHGARKYQACREEAVALTAITKSKHGDHIHNTIRANALRPKVNIWSITGELMPGVIILKAPHGVGKTQLVGRLFAGDAGELARPGAGALLAGGRSSAAFRRAVSGSYLASNGG